MGNCCPKRSRRRASVGHDAPTSTTKATSAPAAPPRRRSSLTSQIKLRYSKQDKELIHRFLPGFVDCSETPSAQHDILVVRDHWERLHVFNTEISSGERMAPVEILFDRFFEYLFREFPALKPLFRGSIHLQGKALNSMVGGMRSILQSDDVIGNAAWLAQRHFKYGIKGEHFNPYGLSLMHALKVAAPRLWTAQVSHSWKSVYCHVSVLILTHLDKVAASEHTEVASSTASKATTTSTTTATASATATATTPIAKESRESSTGATRRKSARNSNTASTTDVTTSLHSSDCTDSYSGFPPEMTRLQKCPYALGSLTPDIKADFGVVDGVSTDASADAQGANRNSSIVGNAIER